MVTVSFANQTVLEVGLRMEIAAIGQPRRRAGEQVGGKGGDLPLVTERRGRRARKGLKNMVTGENNELWWEKEMVRE